MNSQGHGLNSKGAREIENEVKMYLINTDCEKCSEDWTDWCVRGATKAEGDKKTLQEMTLEAKI